MANNAHQFHGSRGPSAARARSAVARLARGSRACGDGRRAGRGDRGRDEGGSWRVQCVDRDGLARRSDGRERREGGPFAQAPQNAVPQLPSQTSAAGTQARFTGHPVTLDFQGADLRTVLRTFADISGLNIVIDQSVQGAVDVSLHEVPWDQALDIILRDHKLGYSVEGTIVRIAPLAVLSDEEAQRRKLAEERALSGDLEVLTRPLSYAKAS